jgi:adenine phosphoribosyltransferase
LEDFYAAIRDVPDFPSPGIVFRDITPLLLEPQLFHQAVERMARPLDGREVDKVLAIESRGFIFGAALALRLRAGLVPARKVGKLPWKTRRLDYTLEYGTDAIEVHLDAIHRGDRVLIVDDLIATGGTVQAAARAVEEAGGALEGVTVLIELSELDGRARLPEDVDFWTVLEYPRKG